MKSIKTKILLVVCLLVVISLLVVGSVVCVLMYKSSLKCVEQTMSETAIVAADLVTEYMETYRAVAVEAGLTVRLADPNVAYDIKKNYMEAKKQQYSLVSAGMADSQGNDLLSGINLSAEPYFQQAMQGESVVSDILFDSTRNAYTINVAAPLWEQGQLGTTVVGVVYLCVDANVLSSITTGIQVGETGSAYMLDKNNFTIAHKSIRIEDRDNTKEALADNSALKPLADIEAKMTSGAAGFGIYEYGGIKKLLAYAPIEGGQSWSLAVTAELSEFIESTYVAIIVTLIIVLLAIIVGIFVSLRLSTAIARPVKEVEAAALALAEGRLDAEIQFTSKDELGRLADGMRTSMSTMKMYIADIAMAMSEMANGNFNLPEPQQTFAGEFSSIESSVRTLMAQMSSTLSQIMVAANQVSAGSEQVSGGAQALSQGTTQQASAVEELSATINEISVRIKNNAENADKGRTQTEQTGRDVQDSNNRMQEMIRAMQEISSKSSEIGKIIKTIEDIAFQTNILALNAAVEAARAGTAGKGFAVVADEVRNLAGKSAEAAKNTTRLIEETVQAVNNGAHLADVTATAMLSVVEGTEGLTDLINAIADASNDQAAAVAQVTMGMDQISSVIQTNSATAEESAAASEELSGQAHMLTSLVNQFNLRKDAIVHSGHH